MKKLAQLVISVFLFGWAVFPSKAAFSSVYVFGDALSATTGNAYGTQPGYGETKDYYGGRYCNGRVWVEVLAQRLGATINYDGAYYDCASSDLSNVVKGFSISPSVASNALFVVWGNNADLFNVAANSGNNWTASINSGQADELYVITTLYNKGVRTLIMPSVVDISKVPQFQVDSMSYLQTMHNESIAYNIAFANTLNQARTTCHGLTIYEPDFFGLLNTVLTNGAAFGLTNALSGGLPDDALDYYNYNTYTNGQGTNFIFWDPLDPSAKLHEIMADETVPMIAPMQIGHITPLNSLSTSICTNRLDLVNVPVGLNGFVEGTTNLGQAGWTWSVVTNITSTSTTQSIFVDSLALPPIPLVGGPNPGGSSPGNSGNNSSTQPPTNAPSYWQSYRVKFPMAWNWP